MGFLTPSQAANVVPLRGIGLVLDLPKAGYTRVTTTYRPTAPVADWLDPDDSPKKAAYISDQDRESFGLARTYRAEGQTKYRPDEGMKWLRQYGWLADLARGVTSCECHGSWRGGKGDNNGFSRWLRCAGIMAEGRVLERQMREPSRLLEQPVAGKHDDPEASRSPWAEEPPLDDDSAQYARDREIDRHILPRYAGILYERWQAVVDQLDGDDTLGYVRSRLASLDDGAVAELERELRIPHQRISETVADLPLEKVLKWSVAVRGGHVPPGIDPNRWQRLERVYGPPLQYVDLRIDRREHRRQPICQVPRRGHKAPARSGISLRAPAA